MAGAITIGRDIRFSKLDGEILSLGEGDGTGSKGSTGAHTFDGECGSKSGRDDHPDACRELWIRDERGQRHAVTVKRYAIPMAVGQKVTLVSAHVGKRHTEHVPAVFFNHDARMCIALKSPHTLFELLNARRSCRASSLLRGALIFVATLSAGLFAIGPATRFAGELGLFAAGASTETALTGAAAVVVLIAAGGLSLRKIARGFARGDECVQRAQAEVVDYFKAIVQSDGGIVR